MFFKLQFSTGIDITGAFGISAFYDKALRIILTCTKPPANLCAVCRWRNFAYSVHFREISCPEATTAAVAGSAALICSAPRFCILRFFYIFRSPCAFTNCIWSALLETCAFWNWPDFRYLCVNQEGRGFSGANISRCNASGPLRHSAHVM